VGEGNRGGIAPVPTRYPPATRVIGKLMAKFPSFSFPSQTANALDMELCIILWMSFMRVPRLLDDLSISHDSPSDGDSIAWQETEGRMKTKSNVLVDRTHLMQSVHTFIDLSTGKNCYGDSEKPVCWA